MKRLIAVKTATEESFACLNLDHVVRVYNSAHEEGTLLVLKMSDKSEVHLSPDYTKRELIEMLGLEFFEPESDKKEEEKEENNDNTAVGIIGDNSTNEPIWKGNIYGKE